nr:hypothetical protein Itr_chr09CG09570 [Ipomoea trifida]
MLSPFPCPFSSSTCSRLLPLQGFPLPSLAACKLSPFPCPFSSATFRLLPLQDFPLPSLAACKLSPFPCPFSSATFRLLPLQDSLEFTLSVTSLSALFELSPASVFLLLFVFSGFSSVAFLLFSSEAFACMSSAPAVGISMPELSGEVLVGPISIALASSLEEHSVSSSSSLAVL